MQRMIEAPLTYLMKLNFLIVANSKIFETYDSCYNLKGPKKVKLFHMIQLHDYNSFRIQWPKEDRRHFQKSHIVLKSRFNKIQEKSLKDIDKRTRTAGDEDILEIMFDENDR